MVFNLFSAPCFGAIGAMRRELGGIKKMLKAIIFQTICAWILATIIYQVGSRIESGVLNVADVIVGGIVAAFVAKIVLSKVGKEYSKCSSCQYCDSCKK